MLPPGMAPGATACWRAVSERKRGRNEDANLVLVGEVGKLRLECGLLCDNIAAAASTEKIIVAGTECDGIIARGELVGILAKEGLFAGQEVVGRGGGTRVLDVGLGYVRMLDLASVP